MVCRCFILPEECKPCLFYLRNLLYLIRRCAAPPLLNRNENTVCTGRERIKTQCPQLPVGTALIQIGSIQRSQGFAWRENASCEGRGGAQPRTKRRVYVCLVEPSGPVTSMTAGVETPTVTGQRLEAGLPLTVRPVMRSDMAVGVKVTVP